MSEATPEAPAPNENNPTPEAPAAAAPGESKPPWGDDFDADKAWKLIENLRSDKEKLAGREFLTPEQKEKLAEYERLSEASQSELERAQKAAEAANNRATGMLRDVATAKLEAALAGLPDEIRTGLLEDINLDKFVKDDAVDVEAIAAFGTKYAAFAAAPEKPGMKPNPSQGRSASPAPSLNEQIAQAQEAGDFKTAIRLKSQIALSASDS